MAVYIALFFSIVSVICISLAVYYYCRFREMSHARYSFEGAATHRADKPYNARK